MKRLCSLKEVIIIFFALSCIWWPQISKELRAQIYGSSTLPDTGQTKCYNSSGIETACAGTGQDGEYNINPMSYTDNGNGTITDNVTGLIWQKEDDNTTRNWADAGTYCDSLTLGGQSDWRLPAKKELINILDYGIPHPGPTINSTYFPNTNANFYWSFTTNVSNTNSALGVFFSNGDVPSYSKSSNYYVRCVRGGQSPAPSFTNNGNGTVTDNGTGLMWQQAEPGSMTWANALSYCEGLSLGGQSDWRLPNAKELGSVTDDTKDNPAIDATYFPNTNAYNYWSSTTSAVYTDGAWRADFSNGHVGYFIKSNNHYVRCVRAGQPGSLCNLTISPTSQTFTSSAAGTGTVNITASGTGCAWTATSTLSWVTITAGSGTGSGTASFSVSANTTGATRTGNITIAGQTFTITQTGETQTNNCAATVSSSLVVHIPILTFSGANYWADLAYNSSNATLTVANAGAVSDTSPYSSCTASTITSDFKLHIPVLMLNGVSYWADLQWNGSAFVITGGGQN